MGFSGGLAAAPARAGGAEAAVGVEPICAQPVSHNTAPSAPRADRVEGRIEVREHLPRLWQHVPALHVPARVPCVPAPTGAW